MSAHDPSYTDLAHHQGPGLRDPRVSVEVSLESARAGLASAKLQLAALLLISGALNLWALGRNGWANTYYSAAVRSMSSSWHDFLYASMDKGGVMTVDKPPLALWVQALSVRVFGYHPLSVLVPQALMGMASVALVYDLVRRRFGRLGGFVAGLALALTPIAVAISRHNNPDALLVLCSVAAVWCAVRALDPSVFPPGTREPRALDSDPTGPSRRRRARWLVLAGVCVGLGFETKMGVALMVVPGIVAAYLWTAPHGRLRALRELGLGGLAAGVVGGAWPLLVELTPAGERPWISGTTGNRAWELITEYNGLGRLEGQVGGPAGGGGGGGGGGGSVFGGSAGPLRLLNAALGGQAGWLLGLAIAGGLTVLLTSRLRRSDPRSGWLLAVGGTFAVVAIVFSGAAGIFHPYYVSLLAPFAAALTGAGVAQLRGGWRLARTLAPAAIVAGVASEIAVLHDYPGELSWLVPVLVVVGAGAAIALGALRDRTIRTTALSCGVAALLIGPAVWAVDTLGHATNGTFPAGGPQSALFGGQPRSFGGGVPLFGPAGMKASGRVGEGPPLPSGGAVGGPPIATVIPPGAGGARAGFAGPGGPAEPGNPGGPSGGAIGAPLGNDATIAEAIAYAKRHGGGTIAVDSQSSAASEIVSSDADVAGIGGFSGRESAVSVAWLADEVGKGAIKWVLSEGGFQGGRRLPGDTRAGSERAIEAADEACRKVTLTSNAIGLSGEAAGHSSNGNGESALYDCQGRAQALLQAQGAQESRT